MLGPPPPPPLPFRPMGRSGTGPARPAPWAVIHAVTSVGPLDLLEVAGRVVPCPRPADSPPSDRESQGPRPPLPLRGCAAPRPPLRPLIPVALVQDIPVSELFRLCKLHPDGMVSVKDLQGHDRLLTVLPPGDAEGTVNVLQFLQSLTPAYVGENVPPEVAEVLPSSTRLRA